MSHNFTNRQWKEKVKEMASLKMKYIVLMGVAITNTNDYTEVFYPSKHFKKAKMIKATDPVKAILSEELPLSIGGGIGQSRLCMLLLGRAHIGEVQASYWDKDTQKQCEELKIELL